MVVFSRCHLLMGEEYQSFTSLYAALDGLERVRRHPAPCTVLFVGHDDAGRVCRCWFGSIEAALETLMNVEVAPTQCA